MTAPGLFGVGPAVVTGAGSGFGAAMVDRFADAGLGIVAIDIDGAGAEATARRVRARGGAALAVALDVTDAAALADAVARTGATFGGCAILCANVGVQQFGAIDALSEDDWRWVMEVNLMGVVRTVAAFLPLMRAGGGERRIAVTSSSAALTPGVRMAAYTASKYAVTGYAETLRMELAAEGIGVSTIFPAGMATRHLESSGLARPAALGPSRQRREDVDAMLASRGRPPGGIVSADHAARHLLADLAANERFIFTHGDDREPIAATQAELLRAYDRGLID